MVLSPEEAGAAIRSRRLSGPVRVNGRLDLTGLEVQHLPAGLSCYELDASNSRLVDLPDDLRVDSRLVLDGCSSLMELPRGLEAGALSLRNCVSLVALPENLRTWFLDLTGCVNFTDWPNQGTVEHGALILRGCVGIRRLPNWLHRLASLDLSGCVQLKEIPEGISVTSWLDVGGASLTGLPGSLKSAALRWRGVRIDERIAFRPEELTATEALAEPNTERRRVLIERIGYLRFSQEARARVLDEDRDPGGPRQLLSIDLREDEPLVGLSCRCPSTGRQYLLRVPPSMRSCHQAAAWIAGYDDPSLYRPLVES